MNAYKPMLARPIDKPFDDPDWLFEVKWDGIRAIAYVGDSLRIRSRNDNEVSHKFPELAELTELISDAVLDGEIIVMKDGEVDFQAVAQRNQVTNPRDIEYLSAKHPATYVVFDILEKGGASLIDRPLDERLSILKSSLRQGRHIVQSMTVEMNGVDYYEAAAKKRLEGVMAKRRDSLYQPGARSSDWLKIKRIKTCDCVVFGYTPGEGAREPSFGALLLGLYDEGKPVYVGRVGTGFTDSDLVGVRNTLNSIRVEEPLFTDPDIPEGSAWVKPRLVAQVGYHEVTNDNRLRAPRFQGFRDDKPPELCSLIQIKPQRLDEYYAKRDFSRTPEPAGGYSPGTGNGFVVQRHQARRLHFDLRLERDGVLVSWAVPKGVPPEPGERRLAVMTEDHPLEYGGFEGTIPEGQYGAGSVEIWDHGFYVPVKWMKDKIEVVLAGNRLKGRYELVRFEKAGEKEWLLFKKPPR
ncbi:non-homologous end-joining DNA ligase [Candidatus Bathyarchaeota archaeon]|nr:non-homologous end-joining DNA ligase [Candidatus Bathyarchaeota archaeon]